MGLSAHVWCACAALSLWNPARPCCQKLKMTRARFQEITLCDLFVTSWHFKQQLKDGCEFTCVCVPIKRSGSSLWDMKARFHQGDLNLCDSCSVSVRFSWWSLCFRSVNSVCSGNGEDCGGLKCEALLPHGGENVELSCIVAMPLWSLCFEPLLSFVF